MGRGQVTVFVVIGIVLIIVFLFIIYLRSVIVGEPLPSGAIGETYDTSRLQGYVGSCIDSVTEEGVRLLGEQGGLLFEDQGGLHTRPPVALDETSLAWRVHDVENGAMVADHTVVGFGLKRRTSYPMRPPYTEPEEYPWPLNEWPTGELADLELDNEQNPLGHADAGNPADGRANYNSMLFSAINVDGAYGQYALPRLCNPYGPNGQLLSGNLLCPAVLQQIPPAVNGPSMQESLASYVESGLESCINETQLSDLLDSSVSREAPNVTLILTENRVVVELLLPLRIGGDGASVKFGTFTRPLPIRLFKLYRYVYHLVKRESKDPFFRIDDPADYASILHHDGYTVQRRTLEEGVQRDDLDIVTVTDPLSSVQQQPFRFQFLVENRYPVLADMEDFVIPEVAPGDSPQRVRIPALDPDGDQLRVAVYGFPAGFDVEEVACPPPDEGDACLLVHESQNGTYPVTVLVNDSRSDHGPRADWQDATIRVP